MKRQKFRAGIPRDWGELLVHSEMKGSCTYADIANDVLQGLRARSRLIPVKISSQASHLKNEKSTPTTLSAEDLREQFHNIDNDELKAFLFKSMKDFKKQKGAYKSSKITKHQNNHQDRQKGNYRKRDPSWPKYNSKKHTFDGVCNHCKYYGHKYEDCKLKDDPSTKDLYLKKQQEKKKQGGDRSHWRNNDKGNREQAHMAEQEVTNLSFTPAQLKKYFPYGCPGEIREIDALVIDMDIKPHHSHPREWLVHVLRAIANFLLRLISYLSHERTEEANIITCTWDSEEYAKIAQTATKNPTHFVIDSGATASTCNRRDVFTNLVPDRTPIKVANGNVCYTEGKGDIGLLKGVYYAPAFPYCLLSVPQLNSMGWEVRFKAPFCTIVHEENGQKYRIGHLENGLYRAPLTIDALVQTGMENAVIFDEETNLFAISEPAQRAMAIRSLSLTEKNMITHRRFAHICDDYLYAALDNKLVSGLVLPKRAQFRHTFCEACALAKSKRVSASHTPGSTHNSIRKPTSTSTMTTFKKEDAEDSN